MIADAYRGKEIKQAIADFFQASTGSQQKPPIALTGPDGKPIQLNPSPELSVYVGHDGLMDFSLEQSFRGNLNSNREAVILACASKAFFGPNLRPTGAHPLIWTTGLLAPEAYTLKAALDGWMAGESGEQIRQRVAKIYAQFQKNQLDFRTASVFFRLVAGDRWLSKKSADGLRNLFFGVWAPVFASESRGVWS